MKERESEFGARAAKSRFVKFHFPFIIPFWAAAPGGGHSPVEYRRNLNVRLTFRGPVRPYVKPR